MMKTKNKIRYKILNAIWLFLITIPQFVQCQQYTQYVDPFIGTAEHGHVFLGASVPFGAVQLGPANIFEGWDWCSGYNYSSNTIVGFTHTHLSGTGIGDLNDILIMPTTGKVYLDQGTKENPDSGYLSTFSHKNEICSAGYYSVMLDKYKIKAELTATTRVGFHQYTFSENGPANIILDLEFGVGWDKPVKTFISIINDSTFTGYRYSEGWAADQRIYFYASLSQPITGYKIYEHDTALSMRKATGESLKAVLSVSVQKSIPLKIKVAISPVSIENAELNMHAEIKDWNFNDVVHRAKNSWNQELGKIKIDAGNDTKKIFYTAMYHTMFAPSVFNDVNGDYFGADKKIHRNAGFTNYTTFSLWDTYRAFHPLFTILHPGKVNDIINTFLAIYQQQGVLPIWHLMGNETYTMNGNHSIPVITDAYNKGFRNYNVSLAYNAMKASVMNKEKDIHYAANLQFIPADTLMETVANALEYAIDDWCIAQMAKTLNKPEDYAYFTKRYQLYKKYFDSNTDFMRGKLESGKWKTPFDPFSSAHRKDDYVEGNAWQYTWLVPEDPHGLIKLFGGDKPFSEKLDSLFTVSGSLGAEASPDISGLIGEYAQGNEPNHHIPYLYAFAGQQWKTAQRIRQIMDTFYTSKPNGLCGNEDLGQMSAWYVFSAMGFYPVNPANGVYVLGSPAVNKASIVVGENKFFTVDAINNNKQNIYIQKADYNGVPYTKSFITYKMMKAGGVLKLYMGNKPSSFGIKNEDRP